MALTRPFRVAAPGAATRQRPIALLIVLASHIATGTAHAEALTEQEALARALQRPAVQALEQGRLAASQSAVGEASRWPNPVVSVAQEDVDGAGGAATEQTVQISQSFDVSGRRGLGRQAARQQFESARAEQRSLRQHMVAEVRLAFAELLYRQRQVEALQQWQARIGQAADTVDKLARAGEVSGYDRRRLQQERHTATSRRDQAAADLLLAQYRLAGQTGTENALTLSAIGELLPDEAPPANALQARIAQRPDLQVLHAEAQAVSLQRRAAAREWLPDITVGVGQKQVDTPAGASDGLALSFSMPLPLFDHGGARQARLAALADALQADYTLRLREAEALLQGQWQQLDRLRQAALQFRQAALQNAGELSRIADTAYRAGEVGVLELLDAYRTELAAHQDALDLERRAQLARIELDALVGTTP
jgi:cobalt-zinc-cadmium efflux system outer membrane protein